MKRNHRGVAPRASAAARLLPVGCMLLPLAGCLIFATILAGRAMAQDSVSIADFRIPETKALDLKGSLSASVNSSDYDRTTPSGAQAPVTESGGSAQASLNAAMSFLFFHTKDDHDQSLRITTSGQNYSYDSHDTRTDTAVVRHENRESDWSGNVSADWSYLHYVTADGIHLMAGATVNYNTLHLRTNVLLSGPFGTSSYEDVAGRYDVAFRGFLGAGFGRIRDGSFVFRALRVVERLIEDKVITRPLSRDEMLKLAERLARTREYTTNFERSDKYFVQDIVDDLSSLGVIAPGTVVSPYASLRILESFQENVQSRFFGWRLYYAINDAHVQTGYHDTYVYSGRGPSESNNIVNNWVYVSRFGLQYGRPLSLFTHLYAEAMLDLPNHDAATRYSLRATASVSHQVGERFLLVGSYGYSGGIFDAFNFNFDQYSRGFSHTFQGKFVYFLEDQLRLGATSSYGWGHSSYGSSGGYFPGSNASSGFNFSFSFGYNII